MNLPEGRKGGWRWGFQANRTVQSCRNWKSQMVCLGSREPLGVVGRGPGGVWESPSELSANVDSCSLLRHTERPREAAQEPLY